MRTILRAAGFLVLALLLLFVGDYASAKFRLPGNRETLGSVDVRVMWAIKLKNGRIDYQFGDIETQPCLHSIFPHLGYKPCWYLTRHKTHEIKVGDARRRRLPLRYSVISCRYPTRRQERIFCSCSSLRCEPSAI